MRKRCSNPACKDYPKYGARGIRVCGEWEDFSCFREWALSHGYRDDLTLDRVNNNKGYGPGNCRWTSRKGQANNRTTASRYTVDGHTKTLAQWSRRYGVPPCTILHRIERGWSVEDAVKVPVNGRRPGS